MSALYGNRLRRIETIGQSLWLDHCDRSLLRQGGLAELIRDDFISGVAFNPTRFEQAVASGDYDAAIAPLAQRGLGPQEIHEALAVEDAQLAADLLRDVYEVSCSRICCGCDGLVSVGLAPQLARDPDTLAAAATLLWERVARPNLMVKVPATDAGLVALRRLIAAGINVHVSWLGGVARYRAALQAYAAGLEDRVAQGGALDHVASVAGFLLGCLDSMVDGLLERDERPAAHELRGQTAIACARLAYREYQEFLRSPRWGALAERGARPQRLLWDCAGAASQAADDIHYVEALIGPDTINVLPLATILAYRDHGKPALRLEQDVEAAAVLPGKLALLGVDLAGVGTELEHQQEQRSLEPYEQLLATLARRAAELGR